MDIKRGNNIILSTPINEGSKRKYTLQQEDYILLMFSLATPVQLRIGDYVDENGLFELIEEYKPKHNITTGGYDYELKLEAYYRKWKNKILKYLSSNKEVSFSLTAKLDAHLGIVLANLQALGYKYRGQDFVFSIDDTVENSAKLITYDKNNILDALSMMAEAYGCEYWVTENIIHFGKCEYGTAVEFEEGINVEEMSVEKNNSTHATRIYAFGGDRNIPSSYRPSTEQAVVNGVVQKRLMLPSDTPYIDVFPGMTAEEAIEDVVIFDDIYPRRAGTISSLSTKEYTDTIENEDGTKTQTKWNAYRFRDTGINFSKDYVIAGKELRIRFESGLLNGMEFAVTFNPDGKAEKTDGSWNPEAQLWEIVRSEDYGRKLPDDTLKPANGDTFVLSGFDTSLVSDTYIPLAEKELKTKAQEYANKVKIDANNYPCKMMYDADSDFYDVGQKVRLVNTAYFGDEGRQSRIIGFEYNLDIPYDHPVYTVGESASYSRLGNMESNIETLTFRGQTYTGVGGNGIYIIRRNDHTPATDNNVYSSLRAIKEFLSATKDTTAEGTITMLKGLLLGNNGSGMSVLQDGTSQAVLDRLYVKVKAVFDVLDVKKRTQIGGEQVLTSAGMRCIGVEDKDTCYRCYFKSEEDGVRIHNDFTEGTLALAKTVNLTNGKSQANRYFWREVISAGTDYIDLSKTICDSGSDVPQAGDDIISLGHRTDVSRQGAILLSSSDEKSPCIIFYQGINDFSLIDKEVIELYYDKVTGKAHLDVYGESYIGRKDRSSYIKYTVSNGVEIRGTLKTSNGSDVEDRMNALQDQIDGVAETFYGEYTPTTTNKPASEWTTDILKARHERDVFTNLQVYVDDETTPDAGKSWRWINNNGTYEWIQIADSDTSKAYFLAAQAAQAALEAQNSANDASKAVDGLKNFTDKAFADGIVDRSEAAAIETYLNNISSIKANVDQSYAKVYTNDLLDGDAKTDLGNSYNTFGGAFTALKNVIDSAIADGKTTALEIAEVDDKFTSFNDAYSDFVNYLNAANNYITGVINDRVDEANRTIAGYDYIRQALKEGTSIDGGLIQSSFIKLGYTDSESVFHVMSGTNGVYDSMKRGGGIAAWYGGDCIDMFDSYDSVQKKFVNVPANVAKGLDRMDGTGYRANGNLWWDENGKVYADPLSFFVGADSVGYLLASFQVFNGGTENAYIISQVPFQALEIASYLQIGDIRIVNDNNGALYIQRTDGTVASFYATGGISAYGKNDGASGGGGAIRTVYGYSDLGGTFGSADYSNTFNAYAVNKLAERIASLEGATITSVDWDVINDRPTALSLFTNDCGFITSSAIPTKVSAFANDKGYLTEHQSLAEYALKTELHSHSNKGVLDGITSSLVGNWNTAYTNNHTHGNKSVLDGITSALVTNWNDANSRKHTHSNKSALDLITLESDGTIKIDADVFTSGGLSVYGKGASGGGGGGTIQTVYGYSDINGKYSDSTFDNTFNAYTIAKLASKISAVESGALTSVDWDIINGRPSALSEFTNDCGFVTSSVVNGYATQSWVNSNFNKYVLPTATSSVLGGVIIGSNITLSGGVISLSKANVTAALGYTPPTTNTTYSAATSSAAGLMSASDKAKLDGIATGANNYTYTLPTASSTVKGGILIGYTQSGKNYPVALDTDGKAYVNVPWSDTNTTYGVATTSANGLMTAAMVTKLNGIAEGATNFTYTLPTATSSVLGGVKVGTGLGISSSILSVSYGTAEGTACQGNDSRLSNSRPASDVYAWAKASAKPSYTYSEVGAAAASHTHSQYLTSHQSLEGYATQSWVNSNFNNYSLPTASSSTKGGILIGYSQSGRNYPVALDSSGKAYVNVPWSDTNTTYGAATSSAAGLMSAADKSKLDGIASGANNFTYSLPTASSSVLGGIKVGTGLGISSSVLSVSYGTAAGTACQGNDSRLSNSRPASDVYAWAKASAKPSYSWSEITGTAPTWNQNTTGNAATATKASTVTINYSNTSNSNYQILFGSSTSLYGSAKILMNPYSGVVTVAGVLSTGGITAYTSSDRRLKANIADFNALSVIKSLGGIYSFDYTDEAISRNKMLPLHSYGVIAQNLQGTILSDLVTENDGFLSVNYASPKLISLALKGVMEVGDEVARLKRRVGELENEISKLKNRAA